MLWRMWQAVAIATHKLMSTRAAHELTMLHDNTQFCAKSKLCGRTSALALQLKCDILNDAFLTNQLLSSELLIA